jgi:hypothetical protein
MNNNNEDLQALSEIRSLMERSSRFISLSGLSGVFAGFFALVGVWIFCSRYNLSPMSNGYYQVALTENGELNLDFLVFIFAVAFGVLLASVLAGVILTTRKAKEKGQSIWDPAAKRLLINLTIPVITGALFCLALMYHRFVGLVVPATLIFYGLALINASKYTLDDVRYLGIAEIILGLIASYYIDFGLLIWVAGFGLFHIIYGIVMYKKYEA